MVASYNLTITIHKLIREALWNRLANLSRTTGGTEDISGGIGDIPTHSPTY